MRTRKNYHYEFNVIFTACAVALFLTVCAAESIIKTKEAIKERDRKRASLKEKQEEPEES